MTSNSSALVASLMSSIDNVKDKLSDGEYLDMCNLLKALHIEINKNKNNDNNNNSFDIIEEQEEEIAEIYNPNLYLSFRVKAFLQNREFYDEDGTFIGDLGYIANKFKHWLNEILELEEENDYNRFFVCACGCSIPYNSIKEHLDDDYHNYNFSTNL